MNVFHELTNELKARFFALYWGQDVIIQAPPNDEIVDTAFVCADRFMWESNIKKYSVLLRPLSSITEEEAYSLEGFGKFSTYTAAKYIQDKGLETKKYTHFVAKAIFLSDNSTKVADYLRSKGFLIDTFGIPVEQWIEWGVVKLKEV